MERRSLLLILSSLIMFSCHHAPPDNVLNVEVSRARYTPQIDHSKHAEYSGQTMLFDSVEVSEDPNITNFDYLNVEKTIGYTLAYSPSSMQQPVASFFWYAMQKTFQSLGMNITGSGLLKNFPQLNLKILSLTDQEAKFRIRLLRNGLLLMQKEFVVSQKLPPTKDKTELEKRQYTYLDLMVDTILSDPDFKREFFSDKGKI